MTELLDVKGAARYLGMSVAFVRKIVLENRVTYFKVGDRLRFRPVDLDAFVEEGRVAPATVSRPERRAQMFQ